jgi:murein DD-endopeptidase MepM/ murein hydrolase activator NlpD
MDIKLKWLAAAFIPLVASCSYTSAILNKNTEVKPIQKQETKVTAKSIPAGNPHQQGAFHIVGVNETLQHICDVYGLNLSEVAKVNRIPAPYSLKPGDTIFLPAHALLDVKDEPDCAAEEKGKSGAIACATKKQSAKALAKAIRGHRDPAVPNLKFPVPGGVLASPFGHRWGRFHRGLDIAARVGAPVMACADGRVVFTGSRKRFRSYGNTVLIDHGKGVYTYYAHLNRILVARNQKVRGGQRIGLVGNSGRSTGPHLHLEVRVANNMFNPLAYFSPVELSRTRLAKRFDSSPMGPVRAKWRVPDLLTARR